MRTCSKATKAKLSKIPRVFPSEWVRVAYYDAMKDKPMSAERERRMMVALGIAKPPRRFYRPCLSLELGEAIQESGIDVEGVLLWYIEMTKEADAAEASRGAVGYEELPQEFEL